VVYGAAETESHGLLLRFSVQVFSIESGVAHRMVLNEKG